MLTAGPHFDGLVPRSRLIAPLLCSVTLVVPGTLMARPAPSEASTPGALSQLASPSNCVTEEEFLVTSDCGTLMPLGLNFADEVQVIPDGKNAYSVTAAGDLVELSRDPVTGALAVIECRSSEPSTHFPCASKTRP